MTQQRRDAHSTEFGLWLREQPEIDSKRGFVASNLDFIWTNYKTGLWMLVEEKRYMSQPRKYQLCLFYLLDKVARMDKLYRGFHVLIFEKTSPEDGTTFLDNRALTRGELIEFFQFELPDFYYESFTGLRTASEQRV